MHINETFHLRPPKQSARVALQSLQPLLTRNDLVPVIHRPNAALLPRPVLQENLLRLSRMAFGRTVGALEARALGQLVQTFASYDVAAGNHHGRVRISSLFLANGTHEDGVEVVRAGQRDLDGQLVLGGPLGAALFHDALHLQQVGQGDGAGGCGDEEGRVGAKAEQRTELAVEGVGDFFPGRVVVEIALVGGVFDVLVVGHSAHEVLDLSRVALREDAEGLPCVVPGAEGTGWCVVH
jgi:hypothetical protein